MKTPTKTYRRFTRQEGKYIDEDGNEITTEYLMQHPHEIFEDSGYVQEP